VIPVTAAFLFENTIDRVAYFEIFREREIYGMFFPDVEDEERVSDDK
jgi:hypothetical protein